MAKQGCSIVVILVFLVILVFVWEFMNSNKSGYTNTLKLPVNGKSGSGCSVEGCPLGGPRVNKENTNLEPTFNTNQIGSADGNQGVSGFGSYATVGAPF